MDLMLGIGTLIFVYVLAMWGRPSGGGQLRQLGCRSARRRWQLSVDSIPEEDEGCQSDPAECLDSSEEEDVEEPTAAVPWCAVPRPVSA